MTPDEEGTTMKTKAVLLSLLLIGAAIAVGSALVVNDPPAKIIAPGPWGEDWSTSQQA